MIEVELSTFSLSEKLHIALLLCSLYSAFLCFGINDLVFATKLLSIGYFCQVVYCHHCIEGLKFLSRYV